jgi:hypothetical protein
MDQNLGTAAEQAAAFQKIWTESATRMFQAAFTASPESPPPEVLRQIRGGIFSALAQSWDEFMRSPQFLQGMKEWMEQAINFRKLSNDWMAKLRNDLQAPSKEDTDTVMVTIRHMEKRVLDRLDRLAAEISAVKTAPSRATRAKTRRAAGGASRAGKTPKTERRAR